MTADEGMAVFDRAHPPGRSIMLRDPAWQPETVSELVMEPATPPPDLDNPFTPAELEAAAAAVHQAYLDACARLGWPVKLANQVPYAELSEESKELDRASVRAVRDALTAAGWRDVHDLEKPGSILCDCDPTPEHQPTNPRTGAQMDHHCDCTAVEVVAQLLGEDATVHGRQCVCGGPTDAR